VTFAAGPQVLERGAQMGVDVVADVAAHRLVEVAVGGDLGDDLRRRQLG